MIDVLYNKYIIMDDLNNMIVRYSISIIVEEYQRVPRRFAYKQIQYNIIA